MLIWACEHAPSSSIICVSSASSLADAQFIFSCSISLSFGYRINKIYRLDSFPPFKRLFSDAHTLSCASYSRTDRIQMMGIHFREDGKKCARGFTLNNCLGGIHNRRANEREKKETHRVQQTTLN